MKKARLTAWVLAEVLCVGTALSGCGNAEETAEEVVESESLQEAEPEEAESEKEVELVDIQEIGDPTASIEIMLTNEMGDVITGLSVKSLLEEEYPDNMMTPDQKIEDKETVRLFYEPVTEEDIKPADDEAILPDESYVGYWGESGDVDETGWELTIFETTDDYVIFHLWGYRTADSDDYIIAAFDSDNVGSFTTYLNVDKAISGTITFYKDSVVVDIEQSEFQMTTPAIFDFGEKHDVSREEGNNKPLEQWEEDKEYVYVKADIDSITTETTEETTEEPTCFLQVTMENGDIYELIDFDVEDMEEVTLYMEDGVAYIEYMSLSQNVLISTKEKEKQIKADKEAAKVVIDMIAAIGTVTEENAEEHRAEIEAARKSYDALTDAQKAYVTNYQLLIDMEQMLNETNNDGSDESSQKKSYEGEDAYIEGYELGIAGYYESDLMVIGIANNWKEIEEEYDYPGAVDEFWEGFYDGAADYEESRKPEYAYTLGMNQGQLGHSLEEAEAVLKENLGITSGSPYYQDFLNGYYDGYNDYSNANYEEDYVNDYDNDNDGDNDEVSYDSGRDNYAWGYSVGSEGVDSSVAQSEALNGGLVQDTQGYYDFQNGYDDGARDYWNNYYESEGIDIPGG